MKSLSFLYCLLFIYSCKQYKEKLTCKDLRTGTFKFSYWELERNDSIQTEKSSTGVILRKQIRWIDDCEYELTYLDGNLKESIAKKKVVVSDYWVPVQRIKIIEVTKTHYVFETVRKNGEVVTGKVWLIKMNKNTAGFKPIHKVFQ